MNEDIRILIDFGSTYTKAVAVDLAGIELIGAARVPSTVDTDITTGLKQALGQLSVGEVEKGRMLACSSAAGGLRMVCAGFVPELTSEAAHRAALGAGARVVGLYSYALNRQEIGKIEAAAPDIVLLTGGTNGGDRKTIIHNAVRLAKTGSSIPNIIVAGNKAAYDEIRDIFKCSSKWVLYTDNVMPEIGVLELDGCHREIRALFMAHIVEAKGIAAARTLVQDIIMPTPSAVMEAGILLAGGTTETPGLGELVVIDVGGATTDVHSIARGNPSRPGIVTGGLPEPYEKRTVEGDLGLRHNIDCLRELVRESELLPGFDTVITSFREGRLPETGEEIACHQLLTRRTVETATARHAGRLEEVYGLSGRTLVQRGKDLTRIGTVIGTGGPLAFSKNPAEILSGALRDEEAPAVLKPENPDFYLDASYILFAVGLLAQAEPDAAMKFAMKYLRRL